MPPQQIQQPQKEKGLFRRTATKGSGQQQKTALRPSQEASKATENTTGQSSAATAGGEKHRNRKKE